MYLRVILLLACSIYLYSCDAVIQLHYTVKNKRKESIKVHVPNYPTGKKLSPFSSKVDTIIEIQPNESMWIGSSMTDIDFPWATKTIYRKHPGICGLELIENDTIIPLDCSSETWKYRKRLSTLKIK